jgi:tetratricopeptide (TPR) repeat protein
MRARASFGIVCLYRGELSKAVQVLSGVYEVACALDFAPDQAVALYELGRVSLTIGDLHAANKALDELLNVADKGELREYQGELREYQVRGRWLQGRLALAQDDLDGALEALEDARGRAQAIGGRLILCRTDSALGDVHHAAGRSAEADAAYGRAWETLQAMAATLADEEAQESLLASSSVAELRPKVKTQ